MDETALAVLVFNPQSENPFEGLGQWDRDLQRTARRKYAKLLVAARCERGGLMVSRDTVEAFRKGRGFAAYLQTSALTGAGCNELRDAIVAHVPWDQISWTASPRIFKLLKDEIVRLKEEGKVLLRMGELKQQLEFRLPGERFSFEELRAVVGLLAGPEVVWQLEFGGFVLLQPERINAYAGAVIRSVRAHTEEIGCIAEERVLAGEIDYQDIERLPPDEEQIVLRAMHQTFVDHGLYQRKRDGAEVFQINNPRHAECWQQQAYPVMLVIRTSDGTIRWMDVSGYLKRESQGGKKVKQIVFKGEPLTAISLRRIRDEMLPLPA